MLETNLQNIPREKKIKKMFVPSVGHRFLEADLSQAEARIVAWYAGEEKLIKMYTDGEDVHSFVASMIFGKPVKKGMTERQTAKSIAHGSNYSMGPMTLVDVVLRENDVIISKEEAAEKQRRYFQNFPNIKGVFQNGIQQELKKNNHIIYNPFGRRRKFFHPWGDELFRQAYSHIPQSTVADIISISMARIFEAAPRFESRIVAQIHDSILLEYPISRDVESIAKMMHDFMTVPFLINDRMLVIPVEVKEGANWGEMEEVRL